MRRGADGGAAAAFFTCPCGKRAYPSRKTAKAAGRVNHPGERLSPYECRQAPGNWHHGHLARDVVTGRRPRSVMQRDAA